MKSNYLNKRGFLSIISEDDYNDNGDVIGTKIKYWLIKRYTRHKFSSRQQEDLNGVVVGIDESSLADNVLNGEYESLFLDDGDYSAPFLISALVKSGVDIVLNSEEVSSGALSDEENKLYSAFSESGNFLFGLFSTNNSANCMIANFDMLLNEKVESVSNLIDKKISDYDEKNAQTIWRNLEDRTDVMISISHILQRKKDTKLTASANSFAELVRFSGGKDKWREFNPLLENSETYFVHQAFFGGFNYLRKGFKGRIIKQPVQVFDVNSMFPNVMANERLPVGEGKWFDGKPIDFKGIYVVRVVITGEIKKNRLPFIRNTKVKSVGYMERFTNMSITLSSVDLDLLFEQYYIKKIEFIGGFSYHSKIGVYRDFVKKLYSEKEEANENGNILQRTISKKKINASFGKLGQKPERKSKGIHFKENGDIYYDWNDVDIVESNYMPAAVFISAYARARVIRTAQKNYTNFIYSDTDSMHLLLTDKKLTFKIDQQKLGYWKREAIYTQSRFIGNKTYMGVNDDKKIIKASGITLDQNIDILDFEPGREFVGGRNKALIKGGAIHVSKRYTLH